MSDMQNWFSAKPMRLCSASKMVVPGTFLYGLSSGMGSRSFQFGPIQARRVVHQQLALELGRRGDVRDEVHQEPIIGHVVLEVRVWPIGSPQYAVGERLDDLAREGNDVSVCIALPV